MRVMLACLLCFQLVACAAPPLFSEDTAQVQEALKAGADPNQTWLGNAPVMYQISSARHDYDPLKNDRYASDPKVALANTRLLLEAGANPNLPENYPPLYHALKYCLPEIAEALLEAGADPRGMAYGDVPMAHALAPNSHCSHVDQQYRLTLLLLDHLEQEEGREAMLGYVRMDDHNYSLVHIAAWQKFYGVLAALIEKQVDLNLKVKSVSYWQQTALEMYCADCTALHIAEGVGHSDIADALRRAGARDDVINAKGLTPAQFRYHLVPGGSTTEKLAAAADIGQMYASMNLAGLLMKNVEGSMELEVFRKSQGVDKDEDVRRREGGPVHPPHGWQGLEKAIARTRAPR